MSNVLLRRLLSANTRPSKLGSRFFTTPPPARKSSSVFRTFRYVTVVTSLALTTYTTGALFPPTTLALLSPRTAPPPPDPNHPDSLAYVAALEEQLYNLPLLAKQRTLEDADAWYETRPYLNLPEERRVNNLTAGALRGPGKLALPPLARARRDESECWIFVHVGRGLCGHDGIVHGGLLATLLDEGLARTAILNLPDKIGVTANLNINYRAPTRADQFIVLKTRLVEAKGRKTRVSGTVEDLDGNVLVEASATFVQPRYSKLLSTESIHQAMGKPEPAVQQPKRDPREILPVPAAGAAASVKASQ